MPKGDCVSVSAFLAFFLKAFLNSFWCAGIKLTLWDFMWDFIGFGLQAHAWFYLCHWFFFFYLPPSYPQFLFENICAHRETFSDSTCFSCSHDMTHLGCSECSLPCILQARIPRHVCRIPASVLHTVPLQQPAPPRHLSAQQYPSCDLVSARPLCHHWKATTSFYLTVKFKFIKQ